MYSGGGTFESLFLISVKQTDKQVKSRQIDQREIIDIRYTSKHRKWNENNISMGIKGLVQHSEKVTET